MDSAQADQDIESMVQSFKERLEPLESGDAVLVLTDNSTGTRYCECHVKAAKLNELARPTCLLIQIIPTIERTDS